MSTSELSKQWNNGESTRTLAEQCNVSRQTLARKLAKSNEKEYQTAAKHKISTGRTKELPVPASEVFEKWASGESQENLEKLCNINYRQILEKLRAYDLARYKEIAERRGLGSIRAKPYGARSLFKLNVRRILEKYSVLAKETRLKLGKHNCRPRLPTIRPKHNNRSNGTQSRYIMGTNQRERQEATYATNTK